MRVSVNMESQIYPLIHLSGEGTGAIIYQLILVTSWGSIISALLWISTGKGKVSFHCLKKSLGGWGAECLYHKVMPEGMWVVVSPCLFHCRNIIKGQFQLFLTDFLLQFCCIWNIHYICGCSSELFILFHWSTCYLRSEPTLCPFSFLLLVTWVFSVLSHRPTSTASTLLVSSDIWLCYIDFLRWCFLFHLFLLLNLFFLHSSVFFGLNFLLFFLFSFFWGGGGNFINLLLLSWYKDIIPHISL